MISPVAARQNISAVVPAENNSETDQHRFFFFVFSLKAPLGVLAGGAALSLPIPFLFGHVPLSKDLRLGLLPAYYRLSHSFP